MGFFDALLGGGKKLKTAAPDRLFAMTTAYVAMETELDMKTTGAAGIVFQPLATSDFEQILRDTQELLAGTAEETGTALESSDDEHGYRWIILRDPDFEDLVVAMNTVSTELAAGGYGDRLLAAVFAFEQKGRRVHFIYNYKRGAFYPFVPSGGEQRRDSEAEMRIKAQLSDEGIPSSPS
ncbi:MAG: hypothetical protein WKF40_01655 [Thermoleophilaceae bacterium]